MSEHVIKLRDIPEETLVKLREIAVRESKWFYDVVRDALVAYAETHK